MGRCRVPMNRRTNGNRRLRGFGYQSCFTWRMMESRSSSFSAHIDTHTHTTSHQQTSCAGVAVLVHVRHCANIQKVATINERLIYIDVQTSSKTIRFIAVYRPHAGYPEDDLQRVYDQLHHVLDNARAKSHGVFVGGVSTRSSMSALVVACYSIFYTYISCMLLVVTAETNMHGLSAALCASDDGLTLFCRHAIFMFRILAHQISRIWVRITAPYALIANWPRCHARKSQNGESNTNGCPRSMCRNSKLQLQKV